MSCSSAVAVGKFRNNLPSPKLSCLSVCLLQDADDGRRSRRSRKDVNYAELNDVYLPPLGPQDYVGNEAVVPTVPSTRSRARRNDVYIQEDYLAPRVRSTSSRRRWRDLEEDNTSQEEEEESTQLQEKNRTICHSPAQHGEGCLEVIDEEDENVSGSTTPDSAQNEPSPKTLQPTEVVVKKPRFACLENIGDDEEDLSPIDALVHQSVVRPLPFRHLNVPSSFHAPPPHPKHDHNPPFPQAAPLHVQVPPILPVPPYQAPPTHHNHHAPFLQAPPLPLSSSLPLPYPGNHYNVMKLPTNYSLPETLLCDEESMNVEERTLASTVAAAPPLSTVNRSTENKNLLPDQQK